MGMREAVGALASHRPVMTYLGAGVAQVQLHTTRIAEDLADDFD